MTQAVDTQPDQPLLQSPHSNIDSDETEHGSTVQLDVLDLSAPGDDY